ncbi:MAG: hypothetical protein O2851_08220, partial [Proteobacteria bacterium]|nr:hypothetical protein [Pseudomonadota bacterium]
RSHQGLTDLNAPALPYPTSRSAIRPFVQQTTEHGLWKSHWIAFDNALSPPSLPISSTKY